MELYLNHMIRSPIKEHIVSAILNQVEIDRGGHAISRSTVKSCVDVLLQLHEGPLGETVYKRDAEPAILKDSETFYTEEAENLLRTCDAPEYLRRVGALIFYTLPFTERCLIRRKNDLFKKRLEQCIIFLPRLRHLSKRF